MEISQNPMTENLTVRVSVDGVDTYVNINNLTPEQREEAKRRYSIRKNKKLSEIKTKKGVKAQILQELDAHLDEFVRVREAYYKKQEQIEMSLDKQDKDITGCENNLAFFNKVLSEIEKQEIMENGGVAKILEMDKEEQKKETEKKSIFNFLK